uniref:Caspase family p20 domain-containing protein n=1 Tax=Globodera rostochiensis TaxID=31243 RepID=A0A914H6A1_GLORO
MSGARGRKQKTQQTRRHHSESDESGSSSSELEYGSDFTYSGLLERIKKGAKRLFFKKNDEDRIGRRLYPNTVSPRGMALIIENVNFVRLSQRTGSWADSSKMRRLLAEMDYTVIFKRNLSAQEMMDAVTRFARRPEYEEAQSCVVCDEPWALRRHRRFRRQLRGSARVCRPAEWSALLAADQQTENILRDQGARVRESVGAIAGTFGTRHRRDSPRRSTSRDRQQSRQILARVPSNQEMLLAMSTAPHHVWVRNPRKGTWFLHSGSIDKAEFVAGFEETLCKGESRGFNGMQRKISTTEYFEDEDQQEVHKPALVRMLFFPIAARPLPFSVPLLVLFRAGLFVLPASVPCRLLLLRPSPVFSSGPLFHLRLYLVQSRHLALHRLHVGKCRAEYLLQHLRVCSELRARNVFRERNLPLARARVLPRPYAFHEDDCRQLDFEHFQWGLCRRVRPAPGSRPLLPPPLRTARLLRFPIAEPVHFVLLALVHLLHRRLRPKCAALRPGSTGKQRAPLVTCPVSDRFFPPTALSALRFPLSTLSLLGVPAFEGVVRGGGGSIGFVVGCPLVAKW